MVEIYRRCHKIAMSVRPSIRCSIEDAEDLASEVWEAIKDCGEKPDAYIAQAIRNLWVSKMRVKRDSLVDPSADERQQLEAKAKEIPFTAGAIEAMEHLWDVKPEWAFVVSMRVAGYKFTEIAKMVGLKKAGAVARYHRAKIYLNARDCENE